MARIIVNPLNFAAEGWESDQVNINPITGQKTNIQGSQLVSIAIPPGHSHRQGFSDGAMFLNHTSEYDTPTMALRRIRLRNRLQTHRLAEISALKYSTYIIHNQNYIAPALVLQIAIDDGLSSVPEVINIVFEPRLQTAISPFLARSHGGEGIPPQHDLVMQNVWQEWNALTGFWRYQYDDENAPLKSLATIIATYPNARIFNNDPSVESPNDGGGVRFTVGGDPMEDYRDFKGYVDGFTINSVNAVTSFQQKVYDFSCSERKGVLEGEIAGSAGNEMME